jgi:NAD-dependent deacetylase
VDPGLRERLRRGAAGRVVALTGAGVSAESGIPTFRGPEGYWTVGSKVYHPQEMATYAAFSRMPREVWRWYLYRRSVCRAATPNAAHVAIVALEHALADRFTLVTQNVDGLHPRAGSSAARTCQIHGNIDFLRCHRRCHDQLHPVPVDPSLRTVDAPLEDADFARLVCPRCVGPARPHVLWFDEAYEEELFRSESAIAAVDDCRLLLVVGTSGSTSLPLHLVGIAMRNEALIVDVDIDDGPFARAAVSSGGCWLRGPAGEHVPELVEVLAG